MKFARTLLTAAVAAAAVFAQSQANSFTASMTIDANDGPFYPMQINIRTNTQSTIAVSGLPGRVYAIFQTVGNLASVPTFFNNVGYVHLPLSPAPIIAVDGFANPQAYNTGPNAFQSFTVNIPAAGNPPAGVPLNTSVCLQAIVQDTTSPLGIRLTAATRATVTQGPTITNLALPGETALPVTMPTGLVLPFYNANYSTIYVCENGFMTFGTPDTDFTPTPPEFESGPPRIAAFWTDLDQSSGQIRATTDANPPGLFPYCKVDYVGVIDWSGVGFVHNFSMYIDNQGLAQIIYPPSNFGSIFETAVGITKGGGAWPAANTPATCKDLSVLQNNGGQSGATSESFFEWFGQTTMPYYTYGVNRTYDLAGRTLTFLPNNGASSTLVGQTSKYYYY